MNFHGNSFAAAHITARVANLHERYRTAFLDKPIAEWHNYCKTQIIDSCA
jgi:hypothetical protein